MSNWKETTLDKIGNVVTGKTPSTKREDYFGGSVPFVTPKDMDGRKIISSTERYLTQAGVKAIENCLLPPNAVMVSCIGSDMGKVALAGRECVTNQQINSIIVNEGVCFDYVYYDLSRRQLEIKSKSSGSAVPILNKGHFEQLRIGLPSLPEQRAIACILGALDDKIELNRRMNRTLEEIARAIFNSWFVEFEFPNAQGKPYKSSGGEMGDSALGKGPKGWKVGSLCAIAAVTSGKRPESRSDTRKDSHAIPLFGGGGPMAFVETPLYEHPIILTGRVGTLGMVFRVTFPCWPSDNTLVIVPRESTWFEFIYLTVSKFDFEAMNRGSTQPLVTQSDLQKCDVLIPDSNIVGEFHRFVDTLYTKRDTNENESRTLAALRDTLLPKLLSGEIRIEDAEKFLKERGL